jgi:glucose/arabinose dehydrogenase
MNGAALRNVRVVMVCAIAVLANVSIASAQSLALSELVQSDAQPTGIHDPNDGSGRLFFLSKAGKILVYDANVGAILPQPFLDLRSLVNSSGVERGLHGLAFHPNYAQNGLFYVMYTNLASDSTLARYHVSADPNVADPVSAEILLLVDQPDQYHNMSQLLFGRDGYLYIGAGDGGFIGDPDNRAQNLSEWLGKILRIDVDGAFPYAIPPDNPFVGVPGARPEIWAYGVRNPWRFSFDRLTNDFYMADVGQWTWEEVNFRPAASAGGENYGWHRMEGTHCYDPATGCESPDLTLPILEYQHTAGRCAVAGGFVYRGARFPRLQGRYFYADWCTGEIWAARRVGGTWASTVVLDSALNPTTFGQDAAGELYIGDDNSGRIYALVDPRPFCAVAMSQQSYTLGETVTASSVRVVNLGSGNVPTRFQLVLVRPSGPPLVVGDTAFPLRPNTETDRGPVDVFTVGVNTPPGTYRFSCRLTNIVTGDTFSKDQAPFEIH